MKVDVMDIFTDESAGKELTEAELAEREQRHEYRRKELPMTIEIEEVTVKDGIVRITALNCSEENLQKLERLRDDCYQKELQFVFDTRNNKSDCIYLTYWLHHQKVTAGCKTYGEAFYRIRGTVTTISGKYLEPAA